jgi:hypothetical protein
MMDRSISHMTNVNRMTPTNRARIYRRRAAVLIGKARNASSERLKTTYLNLAVSWQELATSVERQVELRTGLLRSGFD